MTIYIHEFSTGIQAEETADGGWVSQGFTGQYMNKTIDPIPRAVQEGISNRDFAVAEGASSDEPAFIGREVAGYEEEWSVIAVVTRGRDDRGRSASVYRYFLSEGLGKLPAIWNWLQSEKTDGRKIFFQPFDPYFETNAIAEPHQDLNENIPYPKKLPDDLKDLLDRSIPILISYDSSYPPTILNKVAEEIKTENHLIAWAYNVEALEEPRGFQVIQPANSRAEDLLKKAIASQPNSPAPISGNQAIISAIKGLVMRDRVKLEQVETIENALANPQIDDAYWELTFKGRGADKALKQGIYSADMVRLLTLKAMLLPETLPEFVDWISKEGKKQESKEVSEHFQAEFSKCLNINSLLQKKSLDGVKFLISQLVKKEIFLNCAAWLLKVEKGIWKTKYNKVSSKEIQTIVKNIQFNNKDECQAVANFFYSLNNYELSGYLYQCCLNSVPKKIFNKIQSQQTIASNKKSNVYFDYKYKIACQKRVMKKVNLYEYIWLTKINIGEGNMRAIVIFGLIVSSLMFGGIFRSFLLKSDAEKTIDKIAVNLTKEYKQEVKKVKKKKVKAELVSTFNNNFDNYTNDLKCDIANKLSQQEEANELPKKLDCKSEQQPINATIILTALKKFDISQKNAQEIINSFPVTEDSMKNNSEQAKKAVERIKQVLGDKKNLQGCAIKIENDCSEDKEINFKETWIRKFYLYQQSNNIYPNGILDEKTLEQLKQEMIKTDDNS